VQNSPKVTEATDLRWCALCFSLFCSLFQNTSELITEIGQYLPSCHKGGTFYSPWCTDVCISWLFVHLLLW